MSNVRRSPRVRAGLIAAALVVPGIVLGGGVGSAAAVPHRVPEGQCSDDLEAHVEEVPDVAIGVVSALEEASVDADTRQITLENVRLLAGDIEDTPSVVVKAVGVPSGAEPKPAVGAPYVVFLSPSNDEGEAASYGARLCDFVPGSQEPAVVQAIDVVAQREAAEKAEREEAEAAAVSWTDLDAGDGTDYASAVLPGFLIAAIGAFGLAGTVLLSAVIGRRR